MTQTLWNVGSTMRPPGPWSVVPVREALQRLIAEGLAIHHPNRGVIVTRLAEADVVEIAELRLLLEPHALRLSAPKLTEADLIGAEAILSRAAATADLFGRAHLHWDFHRALYACPDRPRLMDHLSTLYTGLSRSLLPEWSRVGLSSNWMGSHLRIVEALRHGDVDMACNNIIEQITAAAARLRERIRETESGHRTQ